MNNLKKEVSRQCEEDMGFSSSHVAQETSLAAQVLSALAMLTAFCTTEPLEATARQTGLVKRASKMTGTIFLALIPFGVWSDATTTLAQLAAKGTPWDAPLAVSPEALYHRLNQRAHAFLQDLISQVLAQVHALDPLGADGLLPAFTTGYLADRPGCALPNSFPALFPGAGGRAAKAGAKVQAVWAYPHSGGDHFALPPWHRPAQQYSDIVVAFAQQGVLFLVDLGDFQIKACASIAEAGADF